MRTDLTSVAGRSAIGRLWPWVVKYPEVARTNLQNQLVYVFDFVWRSIFLLIIVYIFTQLWRTTFSSMGMTSLNGYTLSQILWYFMFAETIVLSHPALSDTIDAEVKQGSVAYALTKPYNYVVYNYCVFTSEAAIRWCVNLLIGCGIVYAVTGEVACSPQGLPLILISVLLSMSLQFCLLMAIGLTAFWLEDTKAVFFIYQKLLFILGGMLLPLEVYPPAFQRLASFLPLRFVVYGPARLFVGFDYHTWLAFTAAQLGWIFVLGGLVALLYRLGVKKLNVNGG